MPLLRCTQKLLKKLRISPVDIEKDTTLGDWYANVLRLDRKQCVIFVNERTLFSFLGIRVSLKPDTVRDVFIERLNFVLIEEGFSPDQVLAICQEYQSLEFGKTNSRSILGSMNDLVHLYDTSVYYGGGLDRCDMGDLTKQMNRTPQKNLGWEYSITELQKLISETAK